MELRSAENGVVALFVRVGSLPHRLSVGNQNVQPPGVDGVDDVVEPDSANGTLLVVVLGQVVLNLLLVFDLVDDPPHPELGQLGHVDHEDHGELEHGLLPFQDGLVELAVAVFLRGQVVLLYKRLL